LTALLSQLLSTEYFKPSLIHSMRSLVRSEEVPKVHHPGIGNEAFHGVLSKRIGSGSSAILSPAQIWPQTHFREIAPCHFMHCQHQRASRIVYICDVLLDCFVAVVEVLSFSGRMASRMFTYYRCLPGQAAQLRIATTTSNSPFYSILFDVAYV